MVSSKIVLYLLILWNHIGVTLLAVRGLFRTLHIKATNWCLAQYIITCFKTAILHLSYFHIKH